MTVSPNPNPNTGTTSTPKPGTALVLGGGGSAGNAWLIGIVAGLHEAGVDVTSADLIVGTSAGSTAAAQLSAASPGHLLADVLATHTPTGEAASAPQSGHPRDHSPARPRHGSGRPAAGTTTLEATDAIIAAASDAADMRRRIGAWAVERAKASPPTAQARWRETVAARLPFTEWPRRALLLTAVDADTGEPVVFDRQGDVGLVDAVAASCSSASAYRIGGRWYIDGGYRSNADNADLAAGCERVLVLSPFGGRSRLPATWGMHLTDQVDRLRAAGSAVVTIAPDDPSRAAFGDSMMDPATRPPAARAGYQQGLAAADRLTSFWR